MKYEENITGLKGVGEKTAKLFHRLGIYTTKDLLYYFPRDYQQYKAPVMLADAAEGEMAAFDLTLSEDFKWKHIRGLSIGTGSASDGKDAVSLTFFNSPYLKGKLYAGRRCLFRGRLKRQNNGRFHLDQPKLFSFEEYKELMDGLQPCYSLTAGLTNKLVAKAASQALERWEETEYLPEYILSEYQLLPLSQAIRQMHFPVDQKQLIEARRRLVFDEFFLFLISVRRLKEEKQEEGEYPMLETAWPERLIESLPYRLTDAQLRVWQEVKGDLTGKYTMNRLIQGDVGSGKTVLAFLALLLCVSNGYQGALMAPTEILAAQHFEQLSALTKKYELPFRPVLLTGSLSASAKRELYAEIEAGDANVVIGTHALIQEKVSYQKLALVVTDEQHRFGVRQREALSGKGGNAHVLVMSATPIPRTLAIILYGDLHLSMVDELPAHRLPVKNCVVGTSWREKAYSFIAKEVHKGRQAYVICPMVESSEDTEGLENVTDYLEKLRSNLPADIQVEKLHGKMKPADKKRIMEEFAAGNIQVLVSTTVIEVGINVPNATVMMIENAERFGLAQLHQLRGRIGRGGDQSYCIFLNAGDQEQASERLDILNKSNDGFFIAEEDLKLRGPGDIFGIRQSGAMDFKVADIYQDSQLLKEISVTVDQLLMTDRELMAPEHEKLRHYLEENTGNFIDFRSI